MKIKARPRGYAEKIRGIFKKLLGVHSPSQEWWKVPNYRGKWRELTKEEVYQRFPEEAAVFAESHNYICSCCGYHIVFSVEGLASRRTPFCPECGADMRDENGF